MDAVTRYYVYGRCRATGAAKTIVVKATDDDSAAQMAMQYHNMDVERVALVPLAAKAVGVAAGTLAFLAAAIPLVLFLICLGTCAVFLGA